jgi:hypothetical protein
MTTVFTGFAEFTSQQPSNTTPPTNSDRIFIGHVLDVIKDSDSLGYDGPETIGAIRVRDVASQYNVAEASIERYAQPLDRTNYRLPLPGEQVICVRAFGMRVLGKFISQAYYLGVVTSGANTTNNIMPFLGTDVKHIDPNKLFPNLEVESKRFAKKVNHNLDVVAKKQSIQKLREGDKILEGRFGGSLKFSSTINSVAQPFSKNQSLDGDPILILKNNRRTSDGLVIVDDDINEDDSSIYLTTTQTAPIELACSSKMKSWNVDIITGETKSSKEDPSVIYQKVLDVTKPITEEYTI